MKILWLLLLSICVAKADADYVHYPERHELLPDGTEVVIQGAGVKLGTNGLSLGIKSFLGNSTRFAKYKNGKLLYDAIYSVNINKFRTSSASFKPNKKKHFFIFDGSVAFGEGLNDDETIHHWINKKSKIYEAYEIGFLGEGPQHHWIRLSEKKLPVQVLQKKGSALIITHESDIGKLVGLIPHLTYGFYFPRLVETRPGEFKNTGKFMYNGSLLQRMLINFCRPLSFCYTWMVNYGHGQVPEEDLAMGARVIEATVKMYREQFDVENVTILWVGSNEALSIFQKNTKLKVIHLDYETQDGSHPSKKGALQIANALFDQKIVE